MACVGKSGLWADATIDQPCDPRQTPTSPDPCHYSSKIGRIDVWRVRWLPSFDTCFFLPHFLTITLEQSVFRATSEKVWVGLEVEQQGQNGIATEF